ncbi:hypothetical protein J437_LFUL011004 [Ladona fulva]|uniref:Cuticle protein CPCFC domain-containing protein n=1 Tax=Ladona fulva TaxID=123851 RepID=A0A8K0KJ74_LADFU|nr:hypothetical protein J437_LFUL011004 [Ladona fulva]
MAAKLIILALCATAVLSTGIPAAKYPAGVSPHTCPNYPYCDNVALAAHAVAPYAAPAYAHYGVHGPVAAAYPAGVDPHTCPNYPYCDNVALAAHVTGAHGVYGAPWAAHGAWAGAAAHYPAGIALVLCVAIALGCANGQAAKYPAGVSPHLCPNYPHCDNAVLGAAAADSAAHAYSAPVYGGYAAPGYAAPGYAAPGYAAPGYAASGHAAVAAVGYPAHVNPHSCPNYPYCGPTPVHVPSKVWAGAAAHGYGATAHNAWAAPAAYAHGGAASHGFSSLAKGGDRYPAGVSPHACPNYPYCH